MKRERKWEMCLTGLRFSWEHEWRKYEKISSAVNKNDALSKLIFITVTWHLHDNLYRNLIHLFSSLSLICDLVSRVCIKITLRHLIKNPGSQTAENLNNLLYCTYCISFGNPKTVNIFMHSTIISCNGQLKKSWCRPGG